MSLPSDRHNSSPYKTTHDRGLFWLIKPLTHLLYRRTVLFLGILLFVSVVAALWNMSNLSVSLIKSQALQSSKLYAQSIEEARSLYSAEVVDVLEAKHGQSLTTDAQGKSGTIPLPITFLIHLSDRLTAQNPGMAVHVYSDYPFPGRAAESGIQDAYEQEALRYLRANPQGQFVRVESVQGVMSLRYAQADIMKASCVACHNAHPASPKTDWKVGDVRGVLTISTPLDGFMNQMNQRLRGTSITLVLLALFGLLGIILVIGRLRQTSRELEQRVQERTIDLQAANAAGSRSTMSKSGTRTRGLSPLFIGRQTHAQVY